VLLSANFVYGPKVDPIRASVSNQEQRAFFKSHVLLNAPVVEVYSMLDKIARRNALSKRQIYKIYNEFKDGSRLSSEDAPHPGIPRTSTDITHEEKLKEPLNEGNYWRTDLAQILSISTSSTKNLLEIVGQKR
jgi:hypothetical protein